MTNRERLRRAVRAAAGGSAGREEFTGLLAARGVLVRLRHSERDPGTVTGYAVALPSRGAGEPVWFGGGRLAADLTLPRLRGRWQDGAAEGRRGPGSRAAVWQTATAAVRLAARQVQQATSSGQWAEAADVCWATADLLEVAAAVAGPRGRQLHVAARQYERAGRESWGRQPAPSQGGRAVRQAARRVHALNTVGRGDAAALAALTAALRGVVGNVAQLRAAQGRLAQAEAARNALSALAAIAARPTGGRVARPAHRQDVAAPTVPGPPQR